MPIWEGGANYTNAQKKFINEFTRTILVQWADCEIRGEPWEAKGSMSVYLEFARFKGWISKRKDKLTAAGFTTAASYLKR